MTGEKAIGLVLAIGALGLGPILYRLFGHSRRAVGIIEGFVLGAVGGLVILHILPRVLTAGEGWALVAFIVGLSVPVVLHRLHDPRAEGWVIALGLVGLATHGAVDGAGLVQGEQALSMAIVLHRLPAGVFIWWLIRPDYGIRVAIIALVGVAVATVVGFVAMANTQLTEAVQFATFEALVGGALLHVLVGHGSPEGACSHHGPTSKTSELAGAAVGVLLALSLLHGDESAALASYGERFLGLVLDTAPALLLGFTFAGLFAGWLPRGTVRWVGRGRPLGQAFRGLVFGAPIPICSCGVLPVYESLTKKAAPATAAMAFLVATPELGIESVLLSFPLLGWELTSARVLAAGSIALAVGVIVGRRVPPSSAIDAEDGDDGPRALRERVQTAIRYGFGEVVDSTMAWILVGIGAAALFQPGQLASHLAMLPSGTHVILFALVSIPVYVCASGATPLAAAFILAGATPGSAVAFLLAGPATNVTTFGVLSRLHGKRIAAAFGLTVFGLACAAGFGVDLLLSGTTAPIPLLAEGHGEVTWWKTAGAVGIGLLLAASLLRQGPRNFLLNMGREEEDECADSCHDHEHQRAHG